MSNNLRAHAGQSVRSHVGSPFGHGGRHDTEAGSDREAPRSRATSSSRSSLSASPRPRSTPSGSVRGQHAYSHGHGPSFAQDSRGTIRVSASASVGPNMSRVREHFTKDFSSSSRVDSSDRSRSERSQEHSSVHRPGPRAHDRYRLFFFLYTSKPPLWTRAVRTFRSR